MELIFTRLLGFLIQVLFLAILGTALYCIIKGKLWLRILLYIVTIVLVGAAAFDIGSSSNQREARMRFMVDFEIPYRLMMSHLRDLLSQHRYQDATFVVTELENQVFHFNLNPNRFETHTNYHDAVRSLIVQQQQIEE